MTNLFKIGQHCRGGLHLRNDTFSLHHINFYLFWITPANMDIVFSATNS